MLWEEDNITQTIDMLTMMKKLLFTLSALTMLCSFVACSPEDNNGERGETKNNPDELTVTGDALDITDHSATLTGYANLSIELGRAEVGIMYDTSQSFDDARVEDAWELDGNNKYAVTVTDLEPSTTYYYKSYVRNGRAVKYGAVKSFTTSFFPVESVSLDKTEYTFNTIGSTLTLNATVLPSDATDKSVEWSSDKESVATVDQTGKVTAVSNGTATIKATATDGSGVFASCAINVKKAGLTLNLRSDWSIHYEGRQEDYVEVDGSLSDMERFSVSCPGAAYFEVRILTSNELADNYGNDLKKYFQDEEGYIAADAEAAGCSFNQLNYIYTTSTREILFDRSRSGEFIYLLIGITNDGKVSGDYTQTTVVFEQEVATADYKKWIGEWLVSNGEVSYRIYVSQSEANWLYRVDGWETGSSIVSGGTVMDQEYIEARFDRQSGNMVFFSQYVGGYDDYDWGWLEEYFLGFYMGTNSVRPITDLGKDISIASFEDGSTSVAHLESVPIGGHTSNTYYSMSYWNLDSKNANPQWRQYNLNTPAFPLTMTKTKSSGLVQMAPEREVNGMTIHKNQPRDRRVSAGNTGVCSEGDRLHQHQK